MLYHMSEHELLSNKPTNRAINITTRSRPSNLGLTALGAGYLCLENRIISRALERLCLIKAESSAVQKLKISST